MKAPKPVTLILGVTVVVILGVLAFTVGPLAPEGLPPGRRNPGIGSPLTSAPLLECPNGTTRPSAGDATPVSIDQVAFDGRAKAGKGARKANEYQVFEDVMPEDKATKALVVWLTPDRTTVVHVGATRAPDGVAWVLATIEACR